MSGQDSTTAGMDSVPLVTKFRIPTSQNDGTKAWRGPQMEDQDLTTVADLRLRQFAIAGQLETDRSTWWYHWQEIADYILPQRARFVTSDTNRGIKRQHKIRNPKASYVMRTLSAGMMTGMTSPARPWFNMKPHDPGLKQNPEITEHLSIATTVLRNLFLSSNLYNELPTVFTDLGGFGTNALCMIEDEQDTFRFYPFPVGSYSVGTNERGVADQFMRKAWFTPRQLIERFGASNVSARTVAAYEKGVSTYCVEAWWYVGPNQNYDQGRWQSKYKRYVSAWWEIGGEDNRALSLKGYDEFPILISRWLKTGEDAYGHCPGMEMLPDVKELQEWTRKEARAADKAIDPPVQAPPSMMNRVSLMPGDVNIVAKTGDKIESVHNIQFNFQACHDKIVKLEGNISEGGYEDLFLMISQDERNEPATAREIAEKHEEKLLALGPVLNQINTDLLGPLVARGYMIALRAGKIPRPPKALQGKDVQVEFVSVLALAQKMTEVSSITQLTGVIGPIAQETADPTWWDKIDKFELIDRLGNDMGVPEGIVIPTAAAKKIGDARQAAAAKQQQLEQQNQQADTAQKLANAPTDSKNALTDALGGPVPGQEMAAAS